MFAAIKNAAMVQILTPLLSSLSAMDIQTRIVRGEFIFDQIQLQQADKIMTKYYRPVSHLTLQNVLGYLNSSRQDLYNAVVNTPTGQQWLQQNLDEMVRRYSR